MEFLKHLHPMGNNQLKNKNYEKQFVNFWNSDYWSNNAFIHSVTDYHRKSY